MLSPPFRLEVLGEERNPPAGLLCLCWVVLGGEFPRSLGGDREGEPGRCRSGDFPLREEAWLGFARPGEEAFVECPLCEGAIEAAPAAVEVELEV